MSYRWQRRDARQKAKKNRMPKHGQSLFLLEDITRKKAEKIKKEKLKKNRNQKEEKESSVE